MTRWIGFPAVFILLASPALGQSVDARRAHEAAARITANGAIEQYCDTNDSPPLPGYSDRETAAACDIIATSEED